MTSAVFSPDGSLVLTASVDGDARIWSAATGRMLHLLRFHVATVSQALFSPDGRWVVTAGTVRRRSLADAKRHAALRRHGQQRCADGGGVLRRRRTLRHRLGERGRRDATPATCAGASPRCVRSGRRG